MTLSLGIDTGGTYTDAVLFEEDAGVVAAAKSLTTRHDFSVGIGQSIDAVLHQSKIDPSEISLVSLSSTLATNALVEGQGGRVCLILIGFERSALSRGGLAEAMRGDPVIHLDGGHNANGDEVVALDLNELRSRLLHLAGEVSAYAVAGLFGVRNPAHEIQARDAIIETTSRPVTCSHELSSKLDGPKRALTCVLNARLINMIHHLIDATEIQFENKGIRAPLMVVQGDGALISSRVAKIKPIETILSGPAASLIGAAWLTGQRDALISDIGGTTTDIAILKNGIPRLEEEGATVGGWQTMVEAVAMHTVGLGGDSEVQAVRRGVKTELTLGPRRLIPLSLFATNYPALVDDTLDRQANRPSRDDDDGRFAVAVGRESAHLAVLSEKESELLESLKKAPQALDRLIDSRSGRTALEHLVVQGLVMLSGLTPSDGAHVLGKHDAWDRDAAYKGAALFARKKDSQGHPIAQDAEEMSRRIVDTLVLTSAETLLAASMDEDGFSPGGLSRELLAADDEACKADLVAFQIGLNVPLVGLGASAATYYPDVAEKLRTEAIIPKHADVANALGAVVGYVRVSASATVTQPEPGIYRVFHSGEPKNFGHFDEAVKYAENELTIETKHGAVQAGAGEIKITISREDNVATIDGQEILIECLVKATASGRPRIAV